MPTRTIAGQTVQVNDEGFMTAPAEWTKDIAVEIAKEEGIAELTPAHWKVIDFCRQNLAHYKVPKIVEFRGELPKTDVGKVSRRELREECEGT